MMARPFPRRRCAILGAGLAGVAALVVAPPGVVPSRASSASGANWTSYLDGPLHDSYNRGATAITTANAGTLTAAWNWMPGKPPITSLGYAIASSPTVDDGVIYIGANNGTFYALDESTGAVIWQDFVGYVASHSKSCAARGFISTATVAKDPSTGVLTVYVAGADGYLYAFNAATGATIWRSVVGIPSKTENNYFNWASPAVANGHVYMGISSQCDHPLVRGGLLSFDQTTGAQQAVFYTVPKGDVGGSVWASPAVGPDGTVYIATGNGPFTTPNLGDSISIIALDGTTLARKSGWQVPLSEEHGGDDDFGASPTLFSAVLPGSSTPTPLIGACNKDGDFYVLDRDDLAAGPVWTDQVATQEECVAGAPFDGTHLWMATPRAEVDGKKYPGTIREVDAATGATVWVDTMPAQIFGTPALDGSGVLSVATYGYGSSEPNAAYLLDASTGAILATLSTDKSAAFAQPVFAGPYVFVAANKGGLTAYDVPSGKDA